MLEARNLHKSFPGVVALRDVGLRLAPGEILGVVGENGAGKSTLMKILAGIQRADSGEILVDDRPVQIHGVRDAQSLGIALIHQELNLCPNLSVGANVFLGREPRGRIRIDTGAIRTQTAEVLERLGANFGPDTLVEALSVGQQQLVEIAKALSADARILIMDEPTASLSQREAEALFKMMLRLRDEGVGIIYISHRLGEIERLASRVTVLRDGEFAGELPRESIQHDNLVRMMVGRDLTALYQHNRPAPGEVVLTVSGVRTAAHPDHAVNLEVRAGEVVGLAGLVGAGRSELLRAIFGVDRWQSGSLVIDGETITSPNPRRSVEAGLALAPEDRKEAGLILIDAVRENLRLARLYRDVRPLGFVPRSGFDAQAEQLRTELGIKSTSIHHEVGKLSGGNQQKVVLGKWLALGPKVFLLDEPTRGVDVGAKAEIYRLMDELAQKGLAVLFASSEMEEVLGLADRVLVMHEGRITGGLDRDAMTEEAIMALATDQMGAA